jgi:hypothetical protein
MWVYVPWGKDHSWRAHTSIAPTVASVLVQAGAEANLQAAMSGRCISSLAASGGRDALVLCNDYTEPTYVYKLPAAGL